MKASEKPIIFVISPYYLPGCQSGALRTLANLVERFSDEFDFRIITNNHDVHDLTPYENVKTDEWNEVKNAKVFYMSEKTRGWRALKRIYDTVNPDIVYLNSFFFPSVIQYLTMRRLGLIKKKPIVITPKGELSAGALKVKSAKKKAFLNWANVTGIYRDLIWQASVSEEKDEIERIKPNSRIFVVNDLPTKDYAESFVLPKKEKESGKVKFIFVSRIDPKKNVKKAVELLANLKGEIEFDIYGPLAFQDYWAECLSIISNLPSHIQVSYKGLLPFEKVLETIGAAHFFLMPTRGENFGHVILESFCAGTPVIISDKTPWTALENNHTGFEISLDDSEKWLRILERCVRMGNPEYQKMKNAARSFALNYLKMPKAETENRNILLYALNEAKKYK